MICPICGKKGKFATIDSRPRDWGVKRMRKCPNCNVHIPTIEIFNASPEAIESLELSKYFTECRYKERKAHENV